MKYNLYFLFLFFLFTSGAGHAQIEKVIVETYYISDKFDSTDTDGGNKLDTGSVTYRIYVDLKPGNKLIEIYGDAYHRLRFSSTKPFFNNVDGETFPKDLKKGTYSSNTVGVDTWLTLGQAAKTLTGTTYFGILKPQDTDGSFVGGANNDGGSAAISNGLLSNTVSAMGLPLTVADGIGTMTPIPTNWSHYGIKDFSSGIDTTIFGSVKLKNEFVSNYAFLKCSGVTGVIPDSNQVLVAQLTTRGQLEFELNLTVLLDGIGDTVRYVANDDTLLTVKKEKKNSFLKYPFPPPDCGCKDPNYIEYNANFECASADSCKHPIVFGCGDTMACNFDPNVNFSIPSLCCYPGSCAGRDITVVCPSIYESAFSCEIHPNPAQSTLYLNVISGTKQSISYTVYNYFGTQVVTQSLGASQRILNQEIDLSELNNGLYLIRINIGNEVVNKQFFKN